jgi:hypothetical protein
VTNEHNGWVPRDFWLEPWEKAAIIQFHLKNPLEGYRRLTFMMLDQDVVAVSPASVWRVLKQAGLLSRWKVKPSRKGTGFEQPLAPHQHWHVDVSYINLSGTFYYLCSVLDGCSRFLVHWDLRESMKEAEIERILERAKEKYPQAKPRIISGCCRSSAPVCNRTEHAPFQERLTFPMSIPARPIFAGPTSAKRTSAALTSARPTLTKPISEEPTWTRTDEGTTRICDQKIRPGFC